MGLLMHLVFFPAHARYHLDFRGKSTFLSRYQVLLYASLLTGRLSHAARIEFIDQSMPL